MRTTYRFLLPVLLMLLLVQGCAHVPAPLTCAPGGRVETLTSEVSLSVKGPKGSSGGRGILLYRAPDLFRLAVLSPFGTTVLDMYAAGERATFVVPSRGEAYVGTVADLPDEGGGAAWRFLRWGVEAVPPGEPGKRLYRVNASGLNEEIVYDDRGIPVRKRLQDGTQVEYLDYACVGGIPFPGRIRFSTPDGGKVAVTFRDPEVNGTQEPNAYVPQTEGLALLPLSSFRGL